ncbi:uncharacterized protein LOC129941239 [Eupeodes corollae]|uniref:uncharacterized protein LOC129941239 n=1 Tax=Eupeodes corollae TaxID=290404 RepID=UPI00248FC2A9|nr:uncharacterized protein LOC129941239 [Eupeodes corollae]
MKPFPFSTTASEEEKNFNYALSKCRRVVENCFGHLKARFRTIGKGLDKINIQCLQNANNNSHREQSEQSTQVDDARNTPSIIRNAIKMQLARSLDGVARDELDADSADGVSTSSSYWDEVAPQLRLLFSPEFEQVLLILAPPQFPFFIFFFFHIL